MRKTIAFFLAVAVLCSFASMASAGEIDGGLKIGYSLPLGDAGEAFDGGLAYGAFAEYNFNSMMSLQGSVLSSDWSGEDNGADFDIIYLLLNAKANFPAGIYTPFLTAGFGGYFYDISGTDVDHKDGGLNFGGGLDIKVTEKISLGVEGTYHYVWIGDPAEDDDDNFDIINLMTTATFSF